MNHLSRRRFLALTGGLLAAGCSPPALRDGNDAAGTTSPTTTSPGGTAPASTDPGVVTTVSTPPGIVPGDRVLVLVELNGGNDAANTLVPDLGSYRDRRPTIALEETDLLRVAGVAGHGLHPSLAPIVPLFDAGRIATVAGVGFEDPDRSHFTSVDRWDRADRMDENLGWLGRWLDTLDADLPALGATSLGHAGNVLLGASRRGSAIENVDAFAFPASLSNSDIRALAAGSSTDPLIAAAQDAFAASVGAVEEFDAIADSVRANDDVDTAGGYGPDDGPFTSGLAVAAELIRSDVGTRVVSVVGNGFDTHSEQLDVHAGLLSDLAEGLARFWTTLDASGDSDRVLLMTTSEFGRRIAENGSAGCDHGAAGVSFLMGDGVAPGLVGSIDTDRLIEGDLVPTTDPRVMFTACLDWLGADVDRVLGRRYDDVQLLA